MSAALKRRLLYGTAAAPPVEIKPPAPAWTTPRDDESQVTYLGDGEIPNANAPQADIGWKTEGNA